MILLVSNYSHAMDETDDLNALIDSLQPIERPASPVPFQHVTVPVEMSSELKERMADKNYLRDYDVYRRGNKISEKYPLHKAVRDGNIDLVAAYTSEGINPISYNHIGLQPLHYAINLADEDRAIEIVDALVDYFQEQKDACIEFLKATTEDNISAVIKLRKTNTHEVLRFFIPSFQSFAKLDVREEILKFSDPLRPFKTEIAKAEMLLKTLESMDIVAMSTRSGLMPLTLAIEAKKFRLAKKLIECSAPVNLESEVQQPLLLALKSGNSELVDLLLNRGSRVTSIVNEELSRNDISLAQKAFYALVNNKLNS